MEIKRILKYDDRRKVLSVKTEEEQDAKQGEKNVGKLKFLSDAEYTEEGIKMILGNANSTKIQAEKTIPQITDRIKEVEEDLKKSDGIELTPELSELKEKLERLKKFMDLEPKKKELKNLKDMLENTEKNLKQANKDITEIKNEIGTRLSLEGK
jgi:chromosome segregation ATPase